MIVSDWIKSRVEFGIGHSFASQLEKHFRCETGEKCGTATFFHALAAVAAEHGIEEDRGGFRCRVKAATVDEQKAICEVLIDTELDALLAAARRRKIEAIINQCRDLLCESDFSLIEAILDNYL